MMTILVHFLREAGARWTGGGDEIWNSHLSNLHIQIIIAPRPRILLLLSLPRVCVTAALLVEICHRPREPRWKNYCFALTTLQAQHKVASPCLLALLFAHSADGAAGR